MRYTPTYPESAVRRMLDPTQLLRGLWLGRTVLGLAILVAAVFVWERARPVDTLVATLAFAGALLATVASAMWVEIYRRPAGRGFLLGQCAVDLLLVTAVVHVTGGWSSQFAALYILVIAVAALLLPVRDGLLVAGAACALYAVDVLGFRNASPQLTVWVQLAVFVVVSLGSGVISARLREVGAGREALAAQLARVQLEAADILRSMHSGILTVDGDGRLLFANPAATELLGLPLHERVGRPVLPLLASVAPVLAEVLANTARAAVPRTRAEGVIHRDGRAVAVGLTTTFAERDGVGRTATAIFQDISDSKRLQALHVRTERLQAVAELSASLAHEIKNPLASIRSATEQLARRHARRPDGDDDERALFALTVREADRLSRLLSEFLDFARTRAPRLAPVSLASVARSAAALVRQHPACAPGVHITVEVGPGAVTAGAVDGQTVAAGAVDDGAADASGGDEATCIAGDEDLLHRAVSNLLLNAVQAVGPTGRVRLAVSAAPRTHRGPEAVLVQVDDDGPGIAPELRERLFEPFVTNKPGGSGLGLAVVHRAVEAHRGTVQVDALPRGTRFTLLLPRTPAEPHADLVPAPSSASPSSPRVPSPLTAAA